MSYWKKSANKNYQSLDNYSNTNNASSDNSGEFYEYEPAIVLDVVLDSSHEVFKNTEITKLDSERWPADVNNKQPLKNDVDYTWIGRALIRMMETQKGVEKENLVWAYPLESNISEYPLINEVVIAVRYLNQVFYTRKVNQNNFINSNEKFGLELMAGGFKDGNIQKGNRELNQKKEFQGPISKSKFNGGYGFEGAVGRYFLVNKNIRSLKRYEGDSVIESRFGQSIRFAAYDDNRKNDQSLDKLKDYATDGTTNPNFNVKAGGGNPMIIIRNRQKPILKEGQTYQGHDKLPTITGTKVEKNVGGYIEEDINYDGSTIAITSGLTITKWVTTCYKQMFEEGKEEQAGFSPSKSTSFKYPVLDGEQMILNSDRIILSARYGELFQYSKKRFGIVTDNEYTVDAHDQIVLNTNNKTTINSPLIYLGEYNQTNEPVLLGQTTVNWLYELCTWLLKHIHADVHTHPKTGKPSPNRTQLPIQDVELKALQDKLHYLMSRRVFVTGGGFAPGKDGGKIKDGNNPSAVNTTSGAGVPGGFKGVNYRK